MTKSLALDLVASIERSTKDKKYDEDISVRWSLLDSVASELRRLHEVTVDAPKLLVAAILVVRAHEIGDRLDERIEALRTLVRPNADHIADASKMIEPDLFANASNMVSSAAATQDEGKTK